MKSARASLVIDRRFCGPPGIANGGYVAGLLAERLGEGPVEVTLRSPTPVGVRLRVEAGAETLRLVHHSGGVLAEARRVARFEDRPPVIPWADIVAAGDQAYAGAEGFETCFGCGPALDRRQSLGVFPRLVKDVVAGCPWRPPVWATDGHGRVRERFVWAALDCCGGFALELVGTAVPVVTGRLTAEILRAPWAGKDCVVLGWQSGSDGRKRFVRSAVVSPQGDLLAHATAVWLELSGRA
ncbi:MAG: PaaI family thioesterase [Candidatus Dormibacteraceae bacterium]